MYAYQTSSEAEVKSTFFLITLQLLFSNLQQQEVLGFLDQAPPISICSQPRIWISQLRTWWMRLTLITAPITCPEVTTGATCSKRQPSPEWALVSQHRLHQVHQRCSIKLWIAHQTQVQDAAFSMSSQMNLVSWSTTNISKLHQLKNSLQDLSLCEVILLCMWKYWSDILLCVPSHCRIRIWRTP